MSKVFTPLAVLALSLTLSAGAFAETRSKNIDLSQDTQVNGTTLPAGTYKVEWDTNGSMAQVKFFKGHKQVASSSAQVKDLKQKNNGTSVVLGNKSSVPTLDEIDFGGTTQALVLSSENANANPGQ